MKIRGCQYYLVGIIYPSLVEIGLTDLPKSGCAMASLATPAGDDTPDNAKKDLKLVSISVRILVCT